MTRRGGAGTDGRAAPRRAPAIRFPVLLFLLLGFPIPNAAVAQPSWLTAAVRDSVAFLEHRSATSLLLYERREIRIDDRGRSRTFVRLAKKLLAPEAVAAREGYLVEGETEAMTVRQLRGWRVERNGTVEELTDRHIARMSPPGREAIFSHGRMVVAGFPQLTFGDVVGYEYEIDNREPYAAYHRHVFQRQQPVRSAEIVVMLPRDWSLQRIGWLIDNVRYEQNGTTHRWTASDLPYRPEEPLMPPWSFLDRELKISGHPPPGRDGSPDGPPDWAAVARRAAVFNDAAIERTPAIRDLADSLTRGGGTARDRIATLASWVQSKVRYVAVEIGPGRWEPHAASSVLASAYGDCKDKVALLRSLLAAVGIHSAAVLVNTAAYVDSGVPSLYQFNHVIAAIPDSFARGVEGWESVTAAGWIFFDPTSDAQPPGLLPPSVQGARALIVDRDEGRLVRLPRPGPDLNRRFRRAEISLAAPDTLRARIVHHDVGPLAHYLRRWAEAVSPKTRLESLRAYYSRRYRTFEIGDLTTSSSGDTSRMEFLLTVPGAFRALGEGIHLQPNIFPIPEIVRLSAPDRNFPVWFGGPHTLETVVVCDPGEGWTIETPDAAVADSCPEGSLEYGLSVREGKVHLRSRYVSRGGLVDVEEYPAARRFSAAVQGFNELAVPLTRKR